MDSFNVISFPRYQTKCVIKFLFGQFDDIINFNTYLQSSSKAMVNMEKKRGGWKYKNLNISRTKTAF